MSGGKLPEGWVDTQLGSIIELKYGKSLAAQTRDGFGFPVYGSNGVVGKHSIPLINKSGLIVGRKGSYGVVNKSIGPFFPIDTTYYIDDFYNQPLEFLFYYLSFLPLTKLNRSTAIPGLNRDDAYDLNIALPPLAEQKIIAEKLDTLLAQVDSTKARLEQIPQILKRFRQALLASAVEGKLNNFDSKKWKLTKVEDLVRIVNGKSFPSTDYQSNGVKLLRPGNLHKSGTVVWTEKNTTYLPKHWTIKRPELSLKNGVLLMNLTAQSLKDEFLGRVCILNRCDEVVLLNQRISAFTSNVKYNVIPYLFIYFRSPQFRTYIDTLDSGTLIKHLNIKDIKSYSLTLPSAEEQHEIVRRVEQLFAYADTIEKQVNNALTRVNNLTQSILAKAFRGELTAQWRAENPDLISGENSAAALLEKIKAERAASGGKKAPRKKA
ncbi:restriction endonuclease subunit S [Salmonella enterica]|nr:restriction endonuclease subunit S [Salmonella enterica]